MESEFIEIYNKNKTQDKLALHRDSDRPDNRKNTILYFKFLAIGQVKDNYNIQFYHV